MTLSNGHLLFRHVRCVFVSSLKNKPKSVLFQINVIDQLTLIESLMWRLIYRPIHRQISLAAILARLWAYVKFMAWTAPREPFFFFFFCLPFSTTTGHATDSIYVSTAAINLYRPTWLAEKMKKKLINF